MSNPSPNPTERVRALMEATHSLSAIFAQENELLEAHRPREIAPLQAEKARLAAAYAQSIREIARSREAIQGADTGLLEELREITRGFEERAARQRALLSGAQAAGEGVVRAIADEAQAAQPSGHYRADKAGDSAPSKLVSVSVNENA